MEEISRCRTYDPETDLFRAHLFLYRNPDNGKVYHGILRGQEDLSDATSIATLQLENASVVSPGIFYPAMRKTWTTVPGNTFSPDVHFIKRPVVMGYQLDDTPDIWPATEVRMVSFTYATGWSAYHIIAYALPFFHLVCRGNPSLGSSQAKSSCRSMCLRGRTC